jgi:hypothetical protein
MSINDARDKVRGLSGKPNPFRSLSNPEGINQYTKGGGGEKNVVKAPRATPDDFKGEAPATLEFEDKDFESIKNGARTPDAVVHTGNTDGSYASTLDVHHVGGETLVIQGGQFQNSDNYKLPGTVSSSDVLKGYKRLIAQELDDDPIDLAHSFNGGEYRGNPNDGIPVNKRP